MKRINTPRAANTYQGAAGGTGHWQDTDPLGGTQFDAQWCEAIQEAICETIEGLGVALAAPPDETGQLWGALEPRLVLSAKLDTDVVTNTYTRAVVGSTSSRASGANSFVGGSVLAVASGARSAVIGNGDGVASGINTGIAGGEGQIVNGDDSFAGGGQNNVVTGARSAMLAGKNARCVDDETIAWGDSDADPGAGTTNSGLTGKITATTGNVHFGGNLAVGGVVDTGVNVEFKIRGTDGGITIIKGSDRPYDSVSPSSIADAGTEAVFEVSNMSVQAASIILWSVANGANTGGIPVMGRAEPGAGTVTFIIYNAGTNAFNGTLVISYMVINPA